MTYTYMVLIVLVLSLVWDLLVARTRLVARKGFWAGYAIIFTFQLIINGWLTYRNVFIYDVNAILNIRVLNQPVEDLIFGFALVLSVQSTWIYAGKRGLNS